MPIIRQPVFLMITENCWMIWQSILWIRKLLQVRNLKKYCIMKASIIICAFNEEKNISDVLIACCKFNPDNEIIVVDDGSTDNTENILTGLSEKYIFRYERL